MKTIQSEIQRVKAELSPLLAEYDAIDLEALTYLRDQTKEAAAAYQPQPHLTVDKREIELLQAADASANALQRAISRREDLERQIFPLQQLLSAPARVTAEHSEMTAKAERVAAAGQAVAACQATVDKLQEQLASANAAYDGNREAAARKALEAAQKGRSAPTGNVDRSAVETLEAAVSLAQADLIEAQAAQTVAQQALADTEFRSHAAQRDIEQLIWLSALRDFDHAVTRWRKWKGPKGMRVAFMPDLREMRIRVERIEQAEAEQARSAAAPVPADAYEIDVDAFEGGESGQ